VEKNNDPEVFSLDTIGGNGTPFRFVYWPKVGEVRYYDRRYTLTPDQLGYGPGNMNEDGQACGGPLLDTDFSSHAHHGIAGWHDVRAWDIDRGTVQLVGMWIKDIKGGKSWA
jgi:hypothetical protein